MGLQPSRRETGRDQATGCVRIGHAILTPPSRMFIGGLHATRWPSRQMKNEMFSNERYMIGNFDYAYSGADFRRIFEIHVSC